MNEAEDIICTIFKELIEDMTNSLTYNYSDIIEIFSKKSCENYREILQKVIFFLFPNGINVHAPPPPVPPGEQKSSPEPEQPEPELHFY